MARAETSDPRVALRTALGICAPILALLLASGVAETASAQRIDAETIIEEERTDGCSRSTASTHTETTLHLVVEPTGEATLELGTVSRSSFRSARRLPGQPISTHGSVSGAHEQHTWSGRATTGATGALRIRFDRVKTAAVNWTGYGTLPLPALRTEPAQVEVRCAPTTLDVYPAAPRGQAAHTAGATERPAPMAGYACTVSGGSAYVLSRLGEIPFSKTIPIARFVSAIFRGEESLLRSR